MTGARYSDLSEHGIVYIEQDSLRWNFWRAALLRRLSERYTVLLVHPVRAAQGYGRILRDLSVMRQPQELLRVGPNRFTLDICFTFPNGGFPPAKALNDWLVARYVRDALRKLDIRKGAVWFTYPWWQGVAEHLREGFVSVYDCVDKFDSYPSVSSRSRADILRWERRIMSSPGLAMAVSPALSVYLRGLGLSRDVVMLPTAITDDVDMPVPSSAEAVHRPSTSRDLPAVGLIGVLNERYDWPLVVRLASHLSGVAILLLAGNVEVDSEADLRAMAELRRMDNVRFTGRLDHPGLRRVISTCSVGILPYRDQPTNRFCSPVKLFDYLEAGLGVVATDVLSLPPETSQQITTAHSNDEFINGVTALLRRTPGTGSGLIEWQAANSYSSRAARVAAALEDHLATQTT